MSQMCRLQMTAESVQEYLAHQKQPTPHEDHHRTLGIFLLQSPGGRVFLTSEVPLFRPGLGLSPGSGEFTWYLTTKSSPGLFLSACRGRHCPACQTRLRPTSRGAALRLRLQTMKRRSLTLPAQIPSLRTTVTSVLVKCRIQPLRIILS